MDNANSHVRNVINPSTTKEIEIVTITIDSFVKENGIHVDFLKIDVEGSEYDVLLGSEVTLTTNRPKIILALHPEAIVANGYSLDNIWDYRLDWAMISVSTISQLIGKNSFRKKIYLTHI